MREILFRGKPTKSNTSYFKDFVYGNLIINEDKYYICLNVNEHIKRDDYEVYMIEVISETIEQYTGLKDKNGVKIFEGDIIRNNLHSIYNKDISKIWCVKFGEYDNSDIEYGSRGNIGFYACDIIYGESEGLNNLPCDNNDYIEVIGNIHDNLELLESEEK